MKGSLFSIGIDLGTTNSALSFTRVDDDYATSQLFEISQWQTATTQSEQKTLPSFLFYPTDPDPKWMVGQYARRQATDLPGRVAQSAKSWLCLHSVDRNAPFLPWASDELTETEKISPIDASAMILGAFRQAWDQAHAELGSTGQLRQPAGHHHRPGLLRFRRPEPHARSRPTRRLPRQRPAPRGTTGRLLPLARALPLPGRTPETPPTHRRARAPRPHRRHRWRHLRLLHFQNRSRQRWRAPRDRSRRRQRSHPPRRRQRRPSARPPSRTPPHRSRREPRPLQQPATLPSRPLPRHQRARPSRR